METHHNNNPFPPPGLTLLYNREQISAAVERLAVALTRDYRDKRPLLVGVLKGSFIFMADLIRPLDFPVEVDFIRLSSYTHGCETSGTVRLLHAVRTPVRGRHVVVVEDIVDSGLTTGFVIDYLAKKGPASLRLCALTDKPARRRTPVKIDYLGLVVPDKFIVGYGLDCDEQYRHLPEVYVMETAD